MDTDVLKNFLKLAETLHFTKASEKAFIAQPALSKQIKQLEADLSVSLFKRNKRNVELTPAGKYFENEVRKLLSNLEHSIKRAQQLDKGEAGEIRIGYTHSVMQSFLPALIKHLNRHFPQVKVVLKEMTNTHQTKALLDKEIDISISPNPVIEVGVKSSVLVKDNFALILPKDHPINNANFKGLFQLAKEAFVLPPKTEGTLYVELIEAMCTDAGFVPMVIHETAFANSGIRLVEEGLGITIEPVSGLARYTNINYIELDKVRQKAELTMLWLPEVEIEFPELFSMISEFSY